MWVREVYCDRGANPIRPLTTKAQGTNIGERGVCDKGVTPIRALTTNKTAGTLSKDKTVNNNKRGPHQGPERGRCTARYKHKGASRIRRAKRCMAEHSSRWAQIYTN